jgi:hypothetical protein
MWLELGTQRISKNLFVKRDYLPQQTSKLEEMGLKIRHEMVAKHHRTGILHNENM